MGAGLGRDPTAATPPPTKWLVTTGGRTSVENTAFAHVVTKMWWEDESHFVLNCSCYADIRREYIDMIDFTKPSMVESFLQDTKLIAECVLRCMLRREDWLAESQSQVT